MRVTWFVIALAACGRFGYDSRVALDADAAIDDPDAGSASAREIGSGWYHACLIDAGQVRCWGDNTSGQLGDGTSGGASPSPVAVVGLPGPAAMVTGAEMHTCALVDGDAYCWGGNDSGQLGTGDSGPRLSPTRVAGLPSGQVTAVSAGRSFTCAIAAGDVYCWGANGTGQLGDGSNSASPTPVMAVGLPGAATAVRAGGDHSCAVDSGLAYCWGHDDAGALGGGVDFGESNVPIQVVDLTEVDNVSIAGFHACGLAAGAVFCWGTGDAGELGDGNRTSSNTPLSVTGMGDAVTAIHVAGGPVDGDATCAIQSGVVFCWGNNLAGRLGDGTTTSRAAPVAVSGLAATAVSISGGIAHFCASLGDGGVWCWGSGTSGQLGDGMMADSRDPVAVFP